MTQLDRWIGANVERLRKQRELSQVDVAERMSDDGFKWSQRTVWAVEKGERPLRLAEAQTFARGLNASLDDLLGEPESLAAAQGILEAQIDCRNAVRELHHALHAAEVAMNGAQHELIQLDESGHEFADLGYRLPEGLVERIQNSVEEVRSYATGGIQKFINEAMGRLYGDVSSPGDPDA